MTRRRFAVVLIASLVFVGAYATGTARQAAAPEYGPAKGTLVIVGGGNTDNTGIMEKFIELGGGPEGRFIIVPTAGGNMNTDGTPRPYKEEQVIGGWLKRGLKNVKMLHTHDPKVADTEEFVKDLRKRRRCGSTAAASGTSSIRTPARSPTRNFTRCWSAAA